MASQNVNRDYDVTFVNPPPPEVQTECPICHCVLFRPRMATCPCGHSYCAACIDRVERDGKPCPLCSQPFGLVDDNRLERILNGYGVYCPHKEKGCEWTGELGRLEHHLNRNPLPDKQFEGCQFQEIECGLCQLYRCERQLMTNHVSDECQNRDIECEYHFAGCDVMKPKQELEQHMKDSVSLHLSLVSIHVQGSLSLKEKEVCELKDELQKSKDTVDGLQKTLTNQRKVMTGIIIAGIVFAILLAFLSISHVMPQVEENQSFRQQANINTLNLTKQEELQRLFVESLKKQSKEAFSTQQQVFKVEINQLSKLRKKVVSQCEALGKELNESLATHQHANRLEMNWLLNLSNQTVSQFEALREELKETMSAHQRTNELEIGRFSTLREQDVLQLREELKESLATQQQANKLEIDRLFNLKKQSDHCEGTVSSQFSETKCTGPSLSESKLKMVETEVEYLRQLFDYPSLSVLMKFTDLIEDMSGRRLLSIPFYVCTSESKSSGKYGYLMRLVVYPNGTGSGTNTHMSVYIHLMKGRYDYVLSWPFRGMVNVGLHHHMGFEMKTFHFIDASGPNTNQRIINGTMAGKGIGYSRFISHKEILSGNTSLYFKVWLHPASLCPTPHPLPSTSNGMTFRDICFWIFMIVMICGCCIICITNTKDH